MTYDVQMLQKHMEQLQDTVDTIARAVDVKSADGVVWDDLRRIAQQAVKRQSVRRNFNQAAHKHTELRAALAELEADYPKLRNLP
jgi:hypothetical protein